MWKEEWVLKSWLHVRPHLVLVLVVIAEGDHALQGEICRNQNSWVASQQQHSTEGQVPAPEHRQRHYRATRTNISFQRLTLEEVPAQEEVPGVGLCDLLSVKERRWCRSLHGQQCRVIARVLHAQMIHCYHTSRYATWSTHNRQPDKDHTKR